MREDESDWFSRWEEELPSPDELIPLSQSLISPDLALAFNIHTTPTPPIPSSQANSSAADSTDLGSEPAGGDEPARTLKRPRLVWTPQLHKRFVDAVAHLGIKNAVPKTIMQLMSVDGLTRENVASHLQKYRLYLKRMQGLSSAGSDPATDRLFASQPVPAHFLNPINNRVASSEHYMPAFVPIATLQQQQQMAAAAAVANSHLQPPQFHHRQVAVGNYGSPTANGQFGSPNGQFGSPGAVNGQFGSPGAGNGQFGSPGVVNGQFGSPGTVNGKFDSAFLARQTQQIQSVQRMSTPSLHSPVGNYIDELEAANANGGGGVGGRTVLTLFPTRDD